MLIQLFVSVSGICGFMLIQLFVSVSGILLKLVGEKWWHNAQRFIIPVIYSGAVSYLSSCWWLGLTTLPMIGAIVLGYKDYGSKDSVARALWLFVICVVSGAFPMITGHLPWQFFFPYIIAAGWIGTLTRNINNNIEAPICGLWIVLPIWFIK